MRVLQEAQDECERADAELLGAEHGALHSTTQKALPQSSVTKSKKPMQSTLFNWRQEIEELPTFRNSCTWLLNEDGHTSLDYLLTKHHTSKEPETPRVQKPIAEKLKRVRRGLGLTSQRKNANRLARAVEQRLLRRARGSLQGLRWRMSHKSFPPPLSDITVGLGNWVFSYGCDAAQKALCYGCVARLVAANHELQETYAVDICTMLGQCFPNPGQQNGSTDSMDSGQ